MCVINGSVSVIIPVYNQNASLNVTLSFFNRQTYNNSLFEIIVVDDGSDVAAEKYIKENRQKFNYAIKFIRQRNQGRASARNTGIRHAQGEILIFNDADRFPHPDFIRCHIQKYVSEEELVPKVVIGCSYDYYGSAAQRGNLLNLDLKVIQRMARKPIFYSKVIQLYEEEYAQSQIRWISYLVGNSSIRKTHIEKVGGFDESFSTWGAEHFDLAIRMVEQNYNFYCCENAMNYHIPHKREAHFYKNNIEMSVELLVQKYEDKKYYLLKEFLFGQISLQELEQQFTHSISRTLLNKPELINTIH